MNLSKTYNNPFLSASLKVGVLLLLIAAIVHLYPRKASAPSYRYEVGRPWSHETLTADFSFPIYKTDAQVEEEQQETLRQFAPYYNLGVTDQQVKNIMTVVGKDMTIPAKRFLQAELTTIYRSGILTADDMQAIRDEGYERVMVVDSKHVARTKELSQLYTPRSAYDSIMRHAKDEDRSTLQQLNLNEWLAANLTCDTITTNSLRQQALAQVALTQGMVMTGEKIIERDEIVTPQHERVLYSLQRALEEQGIASHTRWGYLVGNLMLTIAFVTLLILYLNVFRPKLFHDHNALLFMSILMAIIVLMACMIKRYTFFSIYLVPFAWLPVIIRVFYDSRTALYVHLVTCLICSIFCSNPFEFLILQVGIGMVAVSSLRDMAQRAQLAQTSVWIFLAYCIGYTGFTLATTGDWHCLSWYMYVYFAANALLVICSYGLIYVFEKSFHLLSNITLVELTNLNSSFMMDFAEKAPGTFQHSLQVGNLAMEAAKRIGANTLLVRTGALYHDIGKMDHPENYTENQHDGINPLTRMSHVSASHAVISHVEAGIAMAEKMRLPAVITQFIQTHHGTSITRYFYNSFLNEHPNANIDRSEFQYPGPKPSSKEAAILMMADAVEARSRSLSEYTEESISEMVHQMIDAQLSDGQFEETPLTFNDIRIIEQTFTQKLIAMNHHRIAYPELNK